MKSNWDLLYIIPISLIIIFLYLFLIAVMLTYVPWWFTLFIYYLLISYGNMYYRFAHPWAYKDTWRKDGKGQKRNFHHQGFYKRWDEASRLRKIIKILTWDDK
jgi:hypothetical protein